MSPPEDPLFSSAIDRGGGQVAALAQRVPACHSARPTRSSSGDKPKRKSCRTGGVHYGDGWVPELLRASTVSPFSLRQPKASRWYRGVRALCSCLGRRTLWLKAAPGRPRGRLTCRWQVASSSLRTRRGSPYSYGPRATDGTPRPHVQALTAHDALRDSSPPVSLCAGEGNDAACSQKRLHIAHPNHTPATFLFLTTRRCVRARSFL